MDCTLDELYQHIKAHCPRQLNTDQRSPRAAILVPITRSDDPELMLTPCATGLSIHGGEVAFPGGRRGSEGVDLVHTALREAEEEIALPPGLVEVVGSLNTLVSRHGIEVTPYAAFTPDFVEYRPNDGEITAVFNMPPNFFRDDPHEVTHRIDYFGRSWHVSNYRSSEFRIWGLTATIVMELANLLYNDPIGLHTPPASFIKLS